METYGGWSEGDATFNGPNRPFDAFIPYYQKTRHIFGDLKIEIFDAGGNLVDTVASSKHRGVNRALWSMHLKPPSVPPAASAAGGATVGPRVLPGDYTVKMTKGDRTYTTKLHVVLDPRAPYTVADRKAQFDLVNKLGGLLNHMSWAVDNMVAVRDQASARAAKLPKGDALAQKLNALAEAADRIRSKVVATKEGGMITGEERLREYLAGLYGDVSGYEGRPTDSQQQRAEALGRELDDVIREFAVVEDQQLSAVNRDLLGRGQPAIRVMAEQDWQRAHSGD
jgi:hypothetical protein